MQVQSTFCINGCVEVMSGQGSVSQVTTGMLALGVVYDSSSSHVALDDANVRVDAVVV